MIAVDGTRLSGNASPEANRDFERLANEILAEAKATDEAEDELYGDARGDELPEQLRTPEGRREFFREAKRDREQEQAEKLDADRDDEDGRRDAAISEFEFDAERIVARVQGREGWSREAKRQLDRLRSEQADPIPRSRAGRLALAAERLEEDLAAERRGNEAYDAYRAQGRMKDGRRFGKPANPYTPPATPAGKVNLTDPDSKQVKTNAGFGWVQGYNAQTVVGAGQIVLAAEITNSTADFGQLEPMVSAALTELHRAGVSERPEVAIADAGYWNEEHMDEVTANKHIQVLIPPDGGNRDGPRPGWTGGRYDWMRSVLDSENGGMTYRRRKPMIEPVFGHTKHNRGIRRFHRRGRAAVRTEWRLIMMSHNLTKLHRHRIAAVGA